MSKWGVILLILGIVGYFILAPKLNVLRSGLSILIAIGALLFIINIALQLHKKNLRLPRFIWLILMRGFVSFPEVGLCFFLWSCKHVAWIRKYARTYRALELMYNYDPVSNPSPMPSFNENNPVLPPVGIKESFFTHFWEQNVDNAQAVRNRLRAVKEELERAISRKCQSGARNIHILSIGSGSARGVIEMLAISNKNVTATLVDISRSALRYSVRLAENLGVEDRIETCRSEISQFLTETDRRFDIIEMVGLAEYLEEEVLISLLEKIWKVLLPGGVLIFSQIAPNREMEFISVIVGWMMIYRSREEIKKILDRTPFTGLDCRSTPLGIHHLYIVTKT